MKQQNKTYIIIATIIRLSILGYGFLDYLQKTNVLKQQQQTIESKEDKLDNCLDEASDDRRVNWINACEVMGRLSDRCSKLLEIKKIKSVEEFDKTLLEADFASLDNFYDELYQCSCQLPTWRVDKINEWQTESKNNCIELYGN